MKRIIILLLLVAPLMAMAQQVDAKLLQGQWTLSDIQSKDSIWVAINPNAQSPATGSKGKVSVQDYPQQKIAIADYMKKDMECGVTRFVFSGNKFEFYRGQALTFSGTVKIKGQQLLLEYNNGDAKSTKENTIITLSAGKLVLGTQSKEKPVTLVFIKK